ncbi:MAG: M10 family metallopeptidase C-terminal domain-containing protein [Methylophilaceae bacterium]
MATISFYQPAKMDDPYAMAHGTSANYSPGGYYSYMTVSQGEFFASFHGDVRYNSYYGYFTGGRITDYVIGHNGSTEYTVENISLDLLVIDGFIGRGDTLGLLRYTITGDDDITGSALNDVLESGDGADTLTGGVGADTLKGEAGADIFKYLSTQDSTPLATDVIFDFTQGTDQIDVSALLGATNLKFSNTTPSINGLWYEQISGNTFVFADTDGNGYADFQIQLNGSINLSNLDFIGTTVLSPLFTSDIDTINFNLISKISYIIGTQYDALSGNDIVLLPSNATKAQAAGYDPSHTFYGGEGNDSITGGALKDIIDGGSGADTLNGGTGADTLIGGIGDDTYIVDNLLDVVTEAEDEGTDTIKATISIDLTQSKYAYVENVILTGKANLNATGTVSINYLTGNTGANILNGGMGVDTMSGSAGNDTYIVDDINDLVVETDANSKIGGIDTVKIANTFIGTDYTLTTNVENLDGSAYVTGINLRGNGLANTTTGGIGNDTLAGSTFEIDHYVNDGLIDTLKGGKGDDFYHIFLKTTGSGSKASVAIQDRVIESTNQGADTIILHGNDNTLTKASKITLTANLEHLDASDTGGTWLNLTGNAANNQIAGNDANNIILGLSGNDTLYGGDGNDSIDGGIGDDVLYGGDGNDTLVGSSGSDTLIGGDGNDTYVVALKIAGTGVNVSAAVEDSNEGIDTFKLTGTAKLKSASIIELTGNLANIENIDASLTGSTLFNLIGNTSNNYLTGNKAVNRLEGGDGNDTLNGGLGNDILTGGNGNDFFILNTSLNATINVDTITDFVSGEDKLYLDNAIFKKLGVDGYLDSPNFHVGNTAQTTSQFLIYDDQTGKLFYDADGSGAGKGVLFANLGIGTTLEVGDIQIV